MTQMPPPTPPNGNGASTGWLGRFSRTIELLLSLSAIVVILLILVPFLRHAALPKPTAIPSTMEQVDWRDPESSLYCVACHRQIAPAAGSLAVQRGHSQNVKLNAVQIEAVARMGTVAGPNNALICMSCHKLGESARGMLAESLADSRLCLRCHPGHYAQGTPHDLRLSAPDERNRFGRSAAEGGPCSACHLAHAHAREIIPGELDPDGYCITCHQEYEVASGRARTERSMQHPESHCLQCHDAHDATFGEFLCEPPAELCLRCHSDYGTGLAGGMHPLGTMDYGVPDELLVAGAYVGGNSHELTCLTCHSMHDPSAASLLVMESDTNRLCLSCHADALIANSAHGDMPRHGQSPILTADQVRAVEDWGTGTGPNGELLCVSCHRVHGKSPNGDLLAFRPQTGDACIACHPGQAAVVGSTHDLRTSYPTAVNALGQTATAAGPCSACHTAHRAGRDPISTEADARGECINCHRAEGVAAARTIDGIPHPQTDCLQCHDPHTRQQPNYLAKAELELCADCHTDQIRIVAGPHDANANPDDPRWKNSPRANGSCMPCHVAHGGERADLYRLGRGDPSSNHDDVCLTCHADAAWGASSVIAAIHPHDISPDQQKVALALVPKDAQGNLRMGCRTCHDPHGGPEPVHLARVAAGESTQSLCLHCHEQKHLIEQTGHSPEHLAKAGFSTDSCKPCHAMHANPDGAWGLMLSPRFLLEEGIQVSEQMEGAVPCLGCHHKTGPAPIREIATHPPAMMTNITPADAPGYMPLFNEQGIVDPRGHVTCRTCHISHGRLDLAKEAERSESLTPDELHNVKMLLQVRPFIPPNVCTECHGPEARAKFLFFHNPRRRSLP